MTILAILIVLTVAGIFAVPAMEVMDRVTERRRLRREDRAKVEALLREVETATGERRKASHR